MSCSDLKTPTARDEIDRQGLMDEMMTRCGVDPLALIGKMPSPLDARDYRHQDEPSEMIVQYGMLALCAVLYTLLFQFLLTRFSRRSTGK